MGDPMLNTRKQVKEKLKKDLAEGHELSEELLIAIIEKLWKTEETMTEEPPVA